MYKRGIAIASFWLISVIGFCQLTSNFVSLDKATYDYYLNKDWKNLVVYGKWGLQNGFDYYYLRMRLGIAYYEQNNYRKAIVHFRKALEFNSKDTTALEYLFYSYLFSGRKTDAYALVSEFPQSLKTRLHVTDKSTLTGLSVYNTYRWNPEFSNITSNFELPVEITVDGWQPIEKNLNYFTFQFEHQLGNKFSFLHGYGYLTKMRNLYVRENVSSTSYTNDRFNQYQVFISGNLSVYRSLSLKLTVHYLNLRPKTYDSASWGGGPYSANDYSTVSPENNWLGYLSGNLDLGLFTFHGGVGFSTLNDSYQFQKDLTLSFFPLGNLNLYSLTKISHQSNYNQSVNYNDHFVFDQTVGFRIAHPVWMELYATWGELSNFSILDGTVIYNDINPVQYKFGINLLVPLSKKGIEFSVLYEYMGMESTYFAYSGEMLDLYNPIKHHIHSITGGIKWNISKN
jgi:hypothetical protein